MRVYTLKNRIMPIKGGTCSPCQTGGSVLLSPLLGSQNQPMTVGGGKIGRTLTNALKNIKINKKFVNL